MSLNFLIHLLIFGGNVPVKAIEKVLSLNYRYVYFLVLK